MATYFAFGCMETYLPPYLSGQGVPAWQIGLIFSLQIVSTAATSTCAADVARKENLGASLGALSSIMDIGHSSGPFVAGVVITATTIAGGFLAAAGVCILSAILFAATAFRKG